MKETKGHLDLIYDVSSRFRFERRNMFRVIKIIIHKPGFELPKPKKGDIKIHVWDELTCVFSGPMIKRFIYSDGIIYERVVVKSNCSTIGDAEEFVSRNGIDEKNSYRIIERKVGHRWVQAMLY